MITLHKFEPGEVILKENETGETAFVIEQGRVEISKELNGKKIHLAYLGADEAFGEMSIIDDKPRSATVTAIEKTLVRELQRDDFLKNLQTDPEVTINILRVLFERLRECHVKILQLEQADSGHAATPGGSPPADTPVCSEKEEVVSIEGLNNIASQALPEDPYFIRKFPFLIGRKSMDPLSYNDLRIPDSMPLQVSRHHIELIIEQGRIGALDRGSHLGSIIDGQNLGGEEGTPGPLFFKGSEGKLVLGNTKSPFKFKIKKL